MLTASRRAQVLTKPGLAAQFLHVSLLLLMLAACLVTRPALAADTAPQPALWKLEDEDSEIWLFGTVHILNPALKWRTAAIDAALEKADTFYSEAPVADADAATMQPLITQYGVNHSGVPFTEKLSPKGQQDLKAMMVLLGLKADAVKQLEPYRPWLAGVTLGALQVQMKGGDPEAGVDKILWHQAAQAGKTLGYFETLEQQISLFGAMSEEEELKFFEDGIRQMITEPDLLDEIIRDWQAGRVEALAHKLNGALEGQASLRDRMLTGRNRAWAATIADLMAGSGRIFVAAGAGHFAGDGSVQDQLEKLGFTVNRVQ